MQMQNEAHKTKGQQKHDGYSTPAPWAQDPIKYNFAILPAASKALYTPEQLTEAAKSAINNTPASNIYYTDGSVDREIPAAAAAVVSPYGYRENWRLSNHASKLQTELVAIAKALEHSADLQYGNTTIHTDSRGAILALRNKEPTENVYLITAIQFLALDHKNNNRQVTLNWIPSHTDIAGNDEADHLAKSALMCQSISITVQPSLKPSRIKWQPTATSKGLAK
ncbi:uncharacterized protein [Palaemon carinicauda]|uniref:uncharacterized protein n=1 Tax=Palaemon carinicauda TaxID=392227 RepID=UPI0035B680A9